MVHEVNEGVGCVVDVKKFAARGTRAPDDESWIAIDLCFVCLADQRWDDVAGVEIEIIVRAVQIGWHR